jgi:hypothetical protein
MHFIERKFFYYKINNYLPVLYSKKKTDMFIRVFFTRVIMAGVEQKFNLIT